MSVLIYPYRQKSMSARRLASMLHGRVLKVDGRTNPAILATDVVINWGASGCPYDPQSMRSIGAALLNSGPCVRQAANKLRSFNVLSGKGVQIPRFATKPEDVCWLHEADTVVRHKLTGHSGEGIEIVEQGRDLPSGAPLYVEYVKKEDEYRVHIIGDRVILVQRKARRKEVENPNWQVRNHQNGFVFVRNEGRDPPKDVITQAMAAIEAFGLDFGAVDVIWNRAKRKAFILEINTAPGMEGTTIADYANGFKNYLKTRS